MKNTRKKSTRRSDGRKWLIRVVFEGGKYGLDDCLTNDDGEVLIEFYDQGGAHVKQFGPRGQFISRYNLSTLDGSDGYGPDTDWTVDNLGLYGGEPEWWVDGAIVLEAIALAQMGNNPTK